MNSLKTSGLKGLSPLTPAALDLRIGIFPSVFNGLLKSTKSSWILALDLRVKQKNQHFCGVQAHPLSPAVTLPLQGYRVVATAYAWPHPLGQSRQYHQSIQSKKPGGDASDQERHRHPHHNATQGEAIWINRV